MCLIRCLCDLMEGRGEERPCRAGMRCGKERLPFLIDFLEQFSTDASLQKEIHTHLNF